LLSFRHAVPFPACGLPHAPHDRAAGAADAVVGLPRRTDNVSYSRDLHARIPLFDIERVEVLKGPQVLLYGNSTTAGALNITTKQPGSTFEADASASYEFNNDETIVQGDRKSTRLNSSHNSESRMPSSA
jgi:outer membrane receptor protein involved in Fe transport